MTDLCIRATVRATGYCLHTEVDNLKIGRYIAPPFSKSVVYSAFTALRPPWGMCILRTSAGLVMLRLCRMHCCQYLQTDQTIDERCPLDATIYLLL